MLSGCGWQCRKDFLQNCLSYLEQPCNERVAGVCLGSLAKALMQTLALTCSRVALVVLLVTGYGCGGRPEARSGRAVLPRRCSGALEDHRWLVGQGAGPLHPLTQGPGLSACGLRVLGTNRRHRLQAAGWA